MARNAKQKSADVSPTTARQRLTDERQVAIERLRALRISPETDGAGPRAGPDTVLDEGDTAQASVYQDMAFAARERLAKRINRLTAALERIERGTYGACRICGGPIEPPRLAALPEADTCLRCQEDLDRVA